MRFAAAMLVLALLFPAAAPLAARVSDACCCTKKAGATCPMKRKGSAKASASACAKPGAVSCGLRRSDPAAALYPTLGEHHPAILFQPLSADVRTARRSFYVANADLLSASPHTPDPPPPKHA